MAITHTNPHPSHPHQLPLQVSLPADARLDALYTGPNAWFKAWLEEHWGQDSVGDTSDREETNLLLEAAPGAGLTHWLQAICRQGEDAGLPVFYLNLADLTDYEPDVLEGMADMPLLCLDDAHRVLGQPGWDEALFHLFNAQRDQGHRLAIGVQRPLSEMQATMLPDLYSRLTWGLRVSLKLPQEDSDWEQAIAWLARQRGLNINQDTVRYLAVRGPRDWRGMAELMATLDTQALAAKRRITQPFIREVTGW